MLKSDNVLSMKPEIRQIDRSCKSSVKRSYFIVYNFTSIKNLRKKCLF